MTYGFSVTKWTKPPSLPSFDGIRLIDITIQNMNILWDFLKELENEKNRIFDISIKQASVIPPSTTPPFGHLTPCC
jgi:hypothetical protein